MRDDAETWRQSLFAPLFLSFFYLEVDVVGVFQRLLVSAPLFPESTLLAAFVFANLFHQIGIDARTKFFDLSLGVLQCALIKGQLLQTTQNGEELIHALIPQEQAFVEAELRGTGRGLRGKGGRDTFTTSHRCLLTGDGG